MKIFKIKVDGGAPPTQKKIKQNIYINLEIILFFS